MPSSAIWSPGALDARATARTCRAGHPPVHEGVVARPPRSRPGRGGSPRRPRTWPRSTPRSRHPRGTSRRGSTSDGGRPTRSTAATRSVVSRSDAVEHPVGAARSSTHRPGRGRGRSIRPDCRHRRRALPRVPRPSRWPSMAVADLPPRAVEWLPWLGDHRRRVPRLLRPRARRVRRDRDPARRRPRQRPPARHPGLELGVRAGHPHRRDGGPLGEHRQPRHRACPATATPSSPRPAPSPRRSPWSRRPAPASTRTPARPPRVSSRPTRPPATDGSTDDATQGDVLLHVYEELAQHLGQLEVTRDVLLAQRARNRLTVGALRQDERVSETPTDPAAQQPSDVVPDEAGTSGRPSPRRRGVTSSPTTCATPRRSATASTTC